MTFPAPHSKALFTVHCSLFPESSVPQKSLSLRPSVFKKPLCFSLQKPLLFSVFQIVMPYPLRVMCTRRIGIRRYRPTETRTFPAPYSKALFTVHCSLFPESSVPQKSLSLRPSVFKKPLCFSLCFRSLCVTRYALCARAELEFDATGPRKRGRFRLHILRHCSPFTVHCSLNPLFLKNLCPSVPLFLKNLSAFLCNNLCFSLC